MGCMRNSHSPFSFFVGINSCHASSHAIPSPRFPLLRLMLLRGCWRRSPSSRRCVCYPCSSLAGSLSFHSSPPAPTMRGERALVWRLGACLSRPPRCSPSFARNGAGRGGGYTQAISWRMCRHTSLCAPTCLSS